jgi:3-isopropylmalate dehydrogenase
MEFRLAVLPGDGIGPEVVREGVKVLEAIGRRYRHTFRLEHGLVGGAAIDSQGTALHEETLALAKRCDAVLFGAVGGPKWDDPKAKLNPQDGILGLRKGLGLFANLRPVKVYPELMDVSTLKPSLLRGVDIMVVRELTGGLYFGKPKRQWTTRSGRRAVDTMRYDEHEVRRIVKVGFELARNRRKKLTSVDKANVLATSRLWHEVASEMAQDYPDVELEHVLVDTASMQLVRNPARFDVIVTENTFGDILTDEASVLAGSMGMLPSASLAGLPAPGQRAHPRQRPDIAGKGIANPIATILSVAMLLRYSLGLVREAEAVERAVAQALAQGYRTADIAQEGAKALKTAEMGDAITAAL